MLLVKDLVGFGVPLAFDLLVCWDGVVVDEVLKVLGVFFLVAQVIRILVAVLFLGLVFQVVALVFVGLLPLFLKSDLFLGLHSLERGFVFVGNALEGCEVAAGEDSHFRA